MSASGYVLGPRAAGQLREMLAERGGEPADPLGLPSNRQVTWVKVTGPKAGAGYPGVGVHAYENGTEIGYAACKVVAVPASVQLRTNKYYLGIRTGPAADGTPVYITNGATAAPLVWRGKQCPDCSFVFWPDEDPEPPCPGTGSGGPGSGGA